MTRLSLKKLASLDTESLFWFWLTILLNSSLIFLTVKMTLQTFPMSPDEYAYIKTAEMFSQGKLSVPSPSLPEFFCTLNFVNNGSYYGKYPPGWPALLAVGYRFGIPWVINPIFSILTLTIIFVLARKLFPPIVSNIAMLLTLACPFYIFNSSCLLSHASGMLLLTLATFFIFSLEDGYMSYVGLGISSGFSLLIRPFTAVLFLTPLLVFAFIKPPNATDKRLLKNHAFITIPIIFSFIGLYLLYNYVQTGKPLLQPFQVYNPFDHLGLFKYTWQELYNRFNQNIIYRLRDWLLWTSGIPLLVLVTLIFHSSDIRNRWSLIFAAPSICLLAGYFFYFGSGVFQYGPRYIYEAYALLLIPATIGLISFRKLMPFLVVLIVVLNTTNYLSKTNYYRYEIDTRVEFFRRAHQLENSIIFIHAENYELSTYFTRNSLAFNDSTLIVVDCGNAHNRKLMNLYPNRNYYLCSFDTADWEKMFKPYHI